MGISGPYRINQDWGIVKTRTGPDRTGPKMVVIERYSRRKINLSAPSVKVILKLVRVQGVPVIKKCRQLL